MSPEEIEIEKAKIEIEKKRLEIAEEVQKREIALSERQHTERSISPAHATVAGALIALLSGLIGAAITSSSSETVSETNAASALQIEKTKVQGNLDLEQTKQSSAEELARQEFETSLILKAIETEDREEAIRNLRFFVNAGFISDENGKISALSDEQLPSQVSVPTNPNFLTRMWQQDKVPVCWEDLGQSDSRLLELVQSTISETWEKHSSIQFTGWDKCTDDATGVRIGIDDIAPHTKALGKHLGV